MDEYVEQTTRGLGSRLWGSIKGMVVGAILFLIAFPVLWFNEGYAVRTAKALTQGEKVVIEVSPDRVDPANEGKLVHVNGKATTSETVTDPMFGVSANTIRLRRKVEMYQWKETSSTQSEKNVGGSQTNTTTYSYSQVWSEQPIDSAPFKQAQGHLNPPMPFTSTDTFAGDMRLGAFRLNRNIAGRLNGADPVDVSQAKLPASIQAPLHPIESGFEIGDPATPRIGNIRVTFEQLRSRDISIVSRQVQDTFEPWRTPSGGSVDLVVMGTRSADDMFAGARSANAVRTWIFRGAGFLLMFIGLVLVLGPLGTLGDVVPFVGNLVRAGAAMASGLLALCFSLVMIALAWIAYRPFLGAVLLAIAAACAWSAARFGGRRGSQPSLK